MPQCKQGLCGGPRIGAGWSINIFGIGVKDMTKRALSLRIFGGFAAALLTSTAFAAEAPRPDQLKFRDLYKELVETNTSLSAGSCTLAAERMAAHLKAAGYSDKDYQVFTAPNLPKEGGLVAVLKGSDPKDKAMLLLAHVDVVEAKREDWQRDPFTLIEEGGFFYARGASDDKAQAAVWVDTLVRLKQEGFKPKRDIKLALTCGEETSSAFNGAGYLAKNKRELIDAAFALNEGAGGRLDDRAKPVALNIQAGENSPRTTSWKSPIPAAIRRARPRTTPSINWRRG